MKRLVFLVFFSTVQASQIPCREEYVPRLIPELCSLTKKPETLTEAVRWGTLEQVQVFLWQRWNPNGVDENGRTSMHYAIYRGDEQTVSILHALLAAGGSMWTQDIYGATVVDDALKLGNKEAIKIFMNNCC